MAKRTIPPEPRSAQAKSSYFRQIKVGKLYYSRQFNPRKSDVRPSQPVPWIQLKGQWLNQAGFTIDTQLSVQVQQGCITLKIQPSPG